MSQTKLQGWKKKELMRIIYFLLDDSSLFRKVMDMKGLVEEEMKRFEGLQLIDRFSMPDSGMQKKF